MSREHTARDTRARRLTGAVFVASIFTSAFLLFSIQPVIARMLLPRFGGTPGVWNTSVVFFQTMLLLGYIYAHWGLRRLGERRLMAVHAALLVASLWSLPPSLAHAPPPVASSWPVRELLVSLSVSVAVPFFLLATNSSLVQHWFSLSRLHRGQDPYRLYAASNAGSLLALLSYPFLVEPVWRVSDQVWLWASGYGAFVALTMAVMFMARRAASLEAVADDGRSASPTPDMGGTESAGPAEPSVTVTWPRRLLWLARAAIAVSLLLSVTVVITTDIAPVPLLWVIPLVIYLLTFILAFASQRLYPRPVFVVGSIACVVVSLSVALLGLPPSLLVTLPLALITLFFGAMLCHGDMARDRPAPSHLTEFYLWVALGGVVGGVLNSIVAPVVFDSVAEYPLTLVALAAVPFFGPGGSGARWRAVRPGSLNVVMPAFMLVLAGWAVMALGDGWRLFEAPGWSLNTLVVALLVPQFLLVAGLVSLAFRRTWSYLLSVILAALFVAADVNDTRTVIHEARSFFGVQRVLETADARALVHGTTVHGIQNKDPDLRDVPGTYYHPSTPLGTIVRNAPDDASIGLVGLGAGALAVLSRPDQTLVYYEIDPLVQEIAAEHFTFLDDSAADVDIVLGDGRLTLADAADGTFDVLVLDAFSSDSIPTHLLTVEAFQLYRDKIDGDGVIMIHLSNGYLDLAQVVRGVAHAVGLHGATDEFVPSAEDRRQMAWASDIAVLSPSASVLDALVERYGWTPIDPGAPATVWTDDYAPLLGVIRWGTTD